MGNLLGTWMIKTKGRKVERNKITLIKKFWEACSWEIKVTKLPCALKKRKKKKSYFLVFNKGDTKEFPKCKIKAMHMG